MTGVYRALLLRDKPQSWKFYMISAGKLSGIVILLKGGYTTQDTDGLFFLPIIIDLTLPAIAPIPYP